jgi:uncharacterized membrane protein
MTSFPGSVNSPVPQPIEPQGEFRTAHLVILLLLSVLAWQTFHYYPLLPEYVASHFGVDGRPNGFQSRAVFFGLMWGIVLLMVFAFVGIPKLIGLLDPPWLNIPNKAYWTEPQRVPALKRLMSSEMSFFGALIIGFLVFVTQLVLNSNMARAPLDNTTFIAGMAVFVICTILWTIRFYRKFAVPK